MKTIFSLDPPFPEDYRADDKRLSSAALAIGAVAMIWMLLTASFASISLCFLRNPLTFTQPITRTQTHPSFNRALQLRAIGFGNVVPPPRGVNTKDKFMLLYTCKICGRRNSNMVSKIAYSHGMVVSTCKQCRSKHLIADNEKKLDMPEFLKHGTDIESVLMGSGERVQRVNLTSKDLEDNFLVDEDGTVKLVPRRPGSETPQGVIEFPVQKP